MQPDVESYESSAIRDPMTDPDQVNPDDGEDIEAEPIKIPYDGDEEEEMNFYGDAQIALTQPAISHKSSKLLHPPRFH